MAYSANVESYALIKAWYHITYIVIFKQGFFLS